MKGWRTNLWADRSTGSGLSRRRGVGDAAAPFFFLKGDFLVAAFLGDSIFLAAAFGGPIFLVVAFFGLEGGLGMIDLEK